MYLPSHCSFRMTDIWRSFVVQRIAWLNGWGILYHAPTVRQERNLHNLSRDFNDEIPGYVYNRRICQELQNLNLKKGKSYLIDNLLICYEELVRNSFLAKKEMSLLNAWITDFNSIYR